jgi:hypothetical protein
MLNRKNKYINTRKKCAFCWFVLHIGKQFVVSDVHCSKINDNYNESSLVVLLRNVRKAKYLFLGWLNLSLSEFVSLYN